MNLFTRFCYCLAGFVLLTLSGAVGQEMNEVFSQMKPYKGEHHRGVNTSTLKGKVMCGYQGWFAAEGDGSGRGWVHYGQGKKFRPGNCTIDLWPDMREMGEDEKYVTPFFYADKSKASVFSSYNKKTVERHFQWMKQSAIDGVFLQRFGSSLRSAKVYNHRNVVLSNVQAGANKHGRTWAVMYDLSGLKAGEIKSLVMEDWKRLVKRMKIKDDKSYLHENGKPVVAVWGIGFNGGRQYNLDECMKLVRFLKEDKEFGGNTVMLGVPAYWRTLQRDAVKDVKLHEIIKQADIISPWTVGRYRTPEGAKDYAEKTLSKDVQWTSKNGLKYMPVAFPGFSWQNLSKTRDEDNKLGHIPRLKGQFLWEQARAFKQHGAGMLYVAMFDEIDEGTAIFKCTNKPPIGDSKFLTYDGLPTDHYLWLTGEITKYFHQEKPLPQSMPVRDK